MLQFLLVIGILSCCFNVSQAQENYKKLFLGQWEDKVSNNEFSFQFVVRAGQFARLKISQANLIDSTPVTRDKLYNYKWVSDNMISFSKMPDEDPLKAKLYPPKHSIMRIDKLTKEQLHVSLSDSYFNKNELDSILKADKGNLSKHIGKRKVQYKKLNLKAIRNKKDVLVLGLWEDPRTDDSTAFQLYIQKGVLGFLKLNAAERKKPTTIKPNGGYNYKWLTDHILYYSKQAATGFTKKDDDPNKYSLLRVELVDQKKMIVTLGARKFNKAALQYIKEEDDFNQYFSTEQVIYKKIPLVKEKCVGTEVVNIGGQNVVVQKKPIIYLYPEQAQEVNVKVHFEGQFTHTYPKYDRATGWTVKAAPDGTLIDPKTNREYYALYWEGENNFPFEQDKGFVVKGEEIAPFLEEKCAQLGLNARETNEFIIYWLPELERNPYNFIHFSTKAYQAQAPMEISPQPDALIRVFMLFEALEEPIVVEPQDLGATPVRKGFTVVEWGGASISKKLTKLK